MPSAANCGSLYVWSNNLTKLSSALTSETKSECDEEDPRCEASPKCYGKAYRFGGWSFSCTSAFVFILLPCFLIKIININDRGSGGSDMFCSDVAHMECVAFVSFTYLLLIYIVHYSLCIDVFNRFI